MYTVVTEDKKRASDYCSLDNLDSQLPPLRFAQLLHVCPQILFLLRANPEGNASVFDMVPKAFLDERLEAACETRDPANDRLVRR